jgi:hypothetical protein
MGEQEINYSMQKFPKFSPKRMLSSLFDGDSFTSCNCLDFFGE